MDVICEIAQNFGDELVGGPPASIPRVAPTEAIWIHDLALGLRGALVHGRGERVQSDNVAMSAMMAVLKTDKECHHTLSRVITEA
jgi:hypothetical protein